MAGPTQNAWSNFGPFQEYTVIYGGTEFIHGQFKPEETHTHTHQTLSLRGWRSWMPLSSRLQCNGTVEVFQVSLKLPEFGDALRLFSWSRMLAPRNSMQV